MFIQNIKEDKEYILPLTELQQEMLFSIDAKIYAFEERISLRFNNEINEPALTSALQLLVDCQPMLRTVYRWEGLREPVMVVLSSIILPLYTSGENPKINIETEPWYIVVGEDKRTLDFCYSHIIMDGWSLGLFFDQLFIYYQRVLKNIECEKVVNHSMKKYAINIKKIDFKESNKFWAAYWENYKPRLLMDSLAKKESFTLGTFSRVLDKKTEEGLKNYSSKANITLSSVYYAAWSVLLSSFLGTDDICMGIISSGRNNNLVGFDSIGMHIKNLPLRVQCCGDFKEVCQDISRSTINLVQYEYASNKDMYLGTGQTQRQRIYDSLVVVENYPLDVEAISAKSGLDVIDFDFTEGPSYPIVVQILQNDKLEVQIAGNANATYEQLQIIGKCYVSLLEQIAEGQFENIETANVCGPYLENIKENEKSDNMFEEGLELNLAQVIINSCNTYADNIALIDNKQQITYKELFDHICRGSNYLKGLGIKEGDPVGVFMGRSVSMLMTVYSILLAGGAYMPISMSVPESRLKNMLGQADTKVIICENEEDKQYLKDMNLDVDIIEYKELSEGTCDIPNVEYSNSNIAYIIFTSGTTGNPKGVEISHKAIINRLVWNSSEIAIGADEVQLFKTPMSFDVSIIEIFLLFFCGHKVVTLPEKYEKMPEKIVKYMENYKVTYIHFVPSMFTQFIRYISVMGVQKCLSTVKRVICSGEVLHADTVNLFYNLPYSYGIEIYNLYGPTEAAVDVSSYVCSGQYKEGIIPIGKPIYNTELRILDAQGRKCPPHVIGVLYILGVNLARDYVNDSERTTEFFRHLADGKRAYYTGDLAYWNEDGDIVVVGRNDSQIKFNGIRIECEEIRMHLINSKLVQDAVVLLKKEFPERLILFYTGNELETEMIRKVLLEKMPGYMLPSDFCHINEIPYSQHGKMDSKKLLSYFMSKQMNDSEAAVHEEMTDTERQLAAIWKYILGESVVVERNSNFFKCGGTSIMIITMVTNIRKQMGIQISTEEIYIKPVLNILAEYIDTILHSAEEKEANIVEEVNYAQRGMASIQMMNANSTAYNLPVLFKMKNGVSCEEVFDAVNNLVASNSYLRTVFIIENGKLISKEIPFESLEYKKTTICANELSENVDRFIRAFKLDELLLRVEFVYDDLGQHYMLFDIHHILCDQKTLHALMHDLALILSGKTIGKIDKNPFLKKINQQNKESHKEYWTKLFAEDNYGCVLPMDLKTQDAHKTLKRYSFVMNSNVRNKVLEYAKSQETTVFNVLFASYFLLTRKLCDKDNIIIGTNYLSKDDSNEMGMNLEILPIKLDISIEESLNTVMNQFKVRFMEAVANNNYSYGELLQELNLYTSSSENPLFEMMFIREENYFQNSNLQEYFEDIVYLNNTAKFDISLFYHETQDGFTFSFDYNSNVYMDSTIKSFAESYILNIEQLITKPSISVAQISLISEENKEVLFNTCMGIRKELPETTVQQLFGEQCMENPDGIAVICGEKQITYVEFEVMTNQIANALDTYQVEGKFVILSLNNSEKLLAAMYGVLKAGAIYLPLDNAFTESRREYIIENSNAVLIISDDINEKYEMVDVLNIDAVLANTNGKAICKGTPSDNAYCIYTSGSTGNPKGCVINQKGLLNYIDWANGFYCKGNRKTFAFYTSPAVDMSVTSTILPLAFGHTIVVYDNRPGSILSVVNDSRVNIIKATPSHLTLIGEQNSVSDSVEIIIVGGEKLTTKVAEQVYRKFDSQVHIYNEYGPTETVVGCMIYEFNIKDPFGAVPIGYPIQNMSTYVLDNSGNICSPYVQGELFIAGLGVTEGYLNNEELTNMKFVKNTVCPTYSAKMYSSGDVVRVIANGVIDYIGRNDNQIKVNGHRIELDEIALATQNLGNINQAIAAFEKGKKENNNIILYYVESKPYSWNELSIRNELSKVLPYYMMPLRITRLDRLPLGSSGKVNLKQLAGMESVQDIQQKKGNEEQFIMQCLSKILGHNNFTSDDGFFEVGINSLSVIELHVLISEKYELEAMDLFRYPSVRSLCEFLTNVAVEEKDVSLTHNEQYAIVGLAFQIPGAETLKDFREILLDGKSRMSYPSGQRYEDEVNKLRIEGYAEEDYRMGMTANINDIDLFAPDYFNIGKDEADVMDPIHKLFLMNTAKALLDAGYDKKSLYGANVAVIGAKPTESGYTEFIEKYYPHKASIAKINKVQSIMLTRLQHFYNLTGPSYLVDSACSSGLVAINSACLHLQKGDCDMAVVGGANLIQLADIKENLRVDVLSPHYHANTFSDNADGTARGEGCICYVIRRLSDAVRDENKIYAVIKGSALNNDGFSSSLTAPNGLAQTNVILKAVKEASIDVKDIGLIESHGTATILGDPIEIQALTKAYGQYTDKTQYCAVGASKAIFGHLDSIAGLMGILKCIVSLKYKELYPNFQLTAPNRRIDFMNSPFYLPMSVQQWKANKSNTRYCGINSFGLSGTNAHVILQQWPKESNKVSECKQLTDYGMNLKRCWIDEEATCEIITSKREVASLGDSVEYVSADSILDTLCEKVQQLFPNIQVKSNVGFYQLGFDSISIIQLQQFAISKYRINIDMEYFFEKLNSLEFLAEYIYEKSQQKQQVNVPIASKVKKEKFIVHQKEAANQNISRKINSVQDFTSYKLKAFVNEFKGKYFKKTKKSLEMMSQDKIHWANGRFILGNTKDLEMMSYPIIVEKAKGTKLWDIDGNEYLDFAMGFGANFFGYNNQEILDEVKGTLETDIVLGAIRPEPFYLAQKICEMTGVERVSFCNSGSEAVMNLLRIARAATSRNKVIAFKGSFHGTFDPIFTQPNELGGSQALPKSIGTPLEFVEQTMLFSYGEEDVFEYIENEYDEIAAVIVEPVQSRHPALRPKEFVKKLRQITKEKNILLIFDEVITGFRSGPEGAQKYYDIEADLVAYGKIIGGGFPIGIFGGKSVYMDLIDHKGWSALSQNDRNGYLVNTGGTFNAHPASIAAASAVVQILHRDGAQIYSRVNALTLYLANDLNQWFEEQKMNIRVEYFCSQFIFISSNVQQLRLLQYMMIYRSIYVWEGGTCFISTEHTQEDVHRLINTVKECCIQIKDIFDEKNSSVKVSQFTNLADSIRIRKLIEKNNNIEKIYPLTSQQLCALASNMNNRGKKIDVSYMHFVFGFEVDRERLISSFSKAINACEALRSAWCWRGVREPIAMVLKQVKPTIEFHLCMDSKEKMVQTVLENRMSNGFMLDNPPYMCMDVLEGKDAKAEIILTYYTSIIDGWSMDLFLDKMLTCYFEEKISSESFDYEEYMEWVYNGQSKQKNIEFWEKHLKDISYQVDSYVPSIGSKISSTTWHFSEEESSRIRMISELCECSRACVISYCFGKALSKDNEDMVIASTVTGRNMEISGMLDAVGLFSNIVPLKVDCNISSVVGLQKLNNDLRHINQLIPLTNAEIAEIADVNPDFIRYVTYNSALVFLNQMETKKWKDVETIEDHGFVAMPRRLYVTLGDTISILVTYDESIYDMQSIYSLEKKMKDVIEVLFFSIQ